MHRTAPEGYRVLVCAPYGRDAESVRAVLAAEGYDVRICPTVAAAAAALDDRIGAVMVTEEALAGSGDVLAAALRAQPAWSDVPFVVLAGRRPMPGLSGEIARRRLAEATGNTIVLERPLAGFSLVSAIASAMRSRQKQFEMRDRLSELDMLNRTLEERVAARTAERNLAATVMETTDALVVVIGPDYRCRALNRAAETEFARMFRRPIGIGDDLIAAFDVFPHLKARARTLWDRALAGEQFTTVEHCDLHDGKPPRAYEMKFDALRDEAGVRIGAFQILTDVTDRIRADAELKQVQEVLRQSQKMEALGQLTGGVAHDFNNLLTPIIGSLDLLRRNERLGDRERRLLAGALQSADRARILVQRLLAFARRQPLQAGPTDIGGLIGGMAGLIDSTVGPMIELRTDLPPDLPAAHVDANQLEMAVLNLCVNARDAMPAGGTITIAATLHDEPAGGQGEEALRPGGYLRLSVADSGTGMDEETLRRAAEPFFSTKGVGRGTGLGLSMVHGLALQLGGRMTIASALGQGTRIDMLLPLSDRPAGRDAPAAESPGVASFAGRALVVDDEPLVRATTAAMLQAIGYAAVEADGGAAALDRLAADARFDLVVTDHLMPEMSGLELAQAIGRRWPAMRVLIVSGYTDVETLDHGVPRLAKPFREAELVEAIARLELQGAA
ncbi:MAG: response regulator [Sphingomonas fennica]